MRQSILALALGGALFSSWALPAEARQDGIVIQNNGVDSSDSAAGADNVRISQDPGNAQSPSAGGVNNEVVRTVREPKDRNRQDRGAQNVAAGAGEAAPVDEYAAPVEGDLQGFSEGGEIVDPAAAPAEVAQSAEARPVALRLPNTGSGIEGSLPPMAALIAAAAFGAGAMGLRRRIPSEM